MTKQVTVCDCCGRESTDYMRDKWIVIERLSQYAGRDESGTAKSCTFISNAEKHFCTSECVADMLNADRRNEVRENKK